MYDLLNMLFQVISLGMLEFITCFYSNKLFKKKKDNVIHIILLILFVPILYILGKMLPSEHLVGCIQAVYLFIYLCVTFEFKFVQGILFLVIEQFVFIACASLGSLCILVMGYDVVLEDKLVKELIPYQLIMMFILYTLVFFAMHIFCMVWKKNEGDTPITQTLLLCGSGVVSTICLVVNAQLVSETGFKTSDVVLSCLLPVTLFIFYLLYFMFSDKYYRVKSITERELITRKYASKSTEYYEKLEQQQREIRKLNHDMRNHLLILQCMKEGNKEQEYVGKLLQEIDEKSGYEDSDNGIADIIFFEKQREARNHGIETFISVEKGILHDYDDVELCTILTNAFDNAMEALIPFDTEKVIVIKGVKTPLGTMLTFENKYDGKITGNGNRLQTTKPDQKNHGYGLENIAQAVERLQGGMDINTDNAHFRLSIMLPD